MTPVTALVDFILKEMEAEYVSSVARPVALYKAKGTYQRDQAHKLALHLVTEGGRKFWKTMKGEGKWHAIYTPEVRTEVMMKLRDQAEKDAESKKYDTVLPKKYQDGFQGYDKPLKESTDIEELLNDTTDEAYSTIRYSPADIVWVSALQDDKVYHDTGVTHAELLRGAILEHPLIEFDDIVRGWYSVDKDTMYYYEGVGLRQRKSEAKAKAVAKKLSLKPDRFIVVS